VGDEGDLGNEGDEGLRVSAGALGADVTLEGEPRRGAIEQARVAEAVAELERRCRADARLAGRAGAVEGDDESGRVAGHPTRIPSDPGITRCEVRAWDDRTARQSVRGGVGGRAT